MHSSDGLLGFLFHFNGHVGRYVDGVYVWFDVGLRNLEGRMILHFSLMKESDTWFEREEDEGDSKNGRLRETLIAC